MTTKKTQNKKTNLKKETSAPIVVEEKIERQVAYPILSFILFIVASVIYFFVGNLFMQLAVEENFCEIRTSSKPQPTGEVVAFINGENVYMSEVQDYIKTIPQLSELPLETIYPQLLETVVDSRVLKELPDDVIILLR